MGGADDQRTAIAQSGSEIIRRGICCIWLAKLLARYGDGGNDILFYDSSDHSTAASSSNCIGGRPTSMLAPKPGHLKDLLFGITRHHHSAGSPSSQRPRNRAGWSRVPWAPSRADADNEGSVRRRSGKTGGRAAPGSVLDRYNLDAARQR